MPDKTINKTHKFLYDLFTLNNALTNGQIYTLSLFKSQEIPSDKISYFDDRLNDIVYLNKDTKIDYEKVVVNNIICELVKSNKFNNMHYIDNCNFPDKPVSISSCVGAYYYFGKKSYKIIMFIIVDTDNKAQESLNKLKEAIKPKESPIIIICRGSKNPLDYRGFDVVETGFNCTNIPQKINNIVANRCTNKYIH